MASIELIKASDGTGNASVATVQSSRSAGATTIDVDTVQDINAAGFAGSMGTPHTFTDPITSETITVISEDTCVDFTGHVDGSNIEIDDIAPGYTDLGSEVGDIIIIRPTTQWGDNVAEVLETAHDDDGSLKDNSVGAGVIADNAIDSDALFTDPVDPVKRDDELTFDYVASGGVWTGDAYASTRAASMTAMICYINGRRISISAVTARSFTASKDTYIDVLDNADGTGTLVYTEVTNNAASPALAANSIRIGIIVTGASNIASVASVNQGEETKLLPIASSIPYAVTDSLGNIINPRDPNRRVLGYRKATGGQGTSSDTYVDLTSVNLVCNIPAGRKVKITANFVSVYNTTSGSGGEINIYDVTSSVQLANSACIVRGTNDLTNLVPSLIYTPPASGVRNFKCQFKRITGGTFNTNVSATQPSYLMVELV